MYTPPNPSNVRLSITISADVHSAFKHLADAFGCSMSKAMGDWLENYTGSVHDIADQVGRLKSSPQAGTAVAVRAAAISEEADKLRGQVRSFPAKRKGVTVAAAAQARRRPARPEVQQDLPLPPPSSNTGGKVPDEGSKGGGNR